MTRPNPVFLVAVLCLAACQTTTDQPRHEVPDSPWLQPSPLLRARIAENVERLPWTHGTERLELIRWFAAVGEPAYDELLELAQDPRTDVAASALAALGATRDQRLVTSIHALEWPAGMPPELQLERARTLLFLGDWSEVPVLIRGLESDDLGTRALAGYALYRVTGDRLGFDPQAPPEERSAAVARWRDWWQGRQLEGLLVQ